MDVALVLVAVVVAVMVSVTLARVVDDKSRGVVVVMSTGVAAVMSPGKVEVWLTITVTVRVVRAGTAMTLAAMPTASRPERRMVTWTCASSERRSERRLNRERSKRREGR